MNTDQTKAAHISSPLVRVYGNPNFFVENKQQTELVSEYSGGWQARRDGNRVLHNTTFDPVQYSEIEKKLKYEINNNNEFGKQEYIFHNAWSII